MTADGLSAQPLRLEFAPEPLDGALLVPDDAGALLILAHGAGAGFDHANLRGIAEALATRRVATLRFNFPFMQAGRRRVDGQAVSVQALTAAVAHAGALPEQLPLFLGGHSFGGRMATHAVAAGEVAPAGLVLLSFPLHPAGRPGTSRAEHLDGIEVPMLFLSGTRDALASADLLAGVVRRLGPSARLHWLDDADHGYRVRKGVRQEPRPVFDEIAEEVGRFVGV